QILRNKLQSPQGARIQGRPLRQALEQLAEDHGFQFRFDEDALKERQVDPEKAEVTINVRGRKLIGILREVLGQHGLRPVLDGDTVVVLALPPLAEGEKRRPVRDNAPLERLVDGQVEVFKEPPVDRAPPTAADRAEPEDDDDSSVAEPGMVENPEQKKAEEEQVRQMRQQFEMQFAGVLRSETRLVTEVVGTDAALREGLTAVGRQQFQKIVNERMRVQRRMMMGWNGRPPNLSEPAIKLRKGFTAFLKERASEAVQEQYRTTIEARVERRKQATIRNLVALLDRSLWLSAEQRTGCEQLLSDNWQPSYGRYLELLQHDGNNWFPNELKQKLEEVLTADQQQIWKLTSTNDLSSFWGFAGEQFQVFSGVGRPPEQERGENADAPAEDTGEPLEENADNRERRPDQPAGDEPGDEQSNAEAGEAAAPRAIPMQQLLPARAIRVQIELNPAPVPADAAEPSEPPGEEADKPADGAQPDANAAPKAPAVAGPARVNVRVMQ
ncbi:MAG: hypothetical protein ACKO3P_13445, partial [Planctomycetaceae bacterium]